VVEHVLRTSESGDLVSKTYSHGEEAAYDDTSYPSDYTETESFYVAEEPVVEEYVEDATLGITLQPSLAGV
jgi:hypothetical protein